MSGGIDWRLASTSSRFPKEAMARIRSTCCPSTSWETLTSPVESRRPVRMTSLETVKAPGRDAVMK